MMSPILSFSLKTGSNSVVDIGEGTEPFTDAVYGYTRLPLSLTLIYSCMSGRINFKHASVAHLFGVSGPSTIFSRITLVVINAVNTVIRGRSLAHIGKEILKRITPAVRNSNAATAIVHISGRAGIGSALHHPFPCDVLNTACSAVSSKQLARNFSVEAPTALSITAGEFAGCWRSLRAAFALAIPVLITFALTCIRYNRKAGKNFTCKVVKACVSRKWYNSISHFKPQLFNLIRGYGVCQLRMLDSNTFQRV